MGVWGCVVSNADNDIQNRGVVKMKSELEIAKTNLEILQSDISLVYEELGFPEDTILADEFVPMLKEKYISKEKIREKIEEYREKRNRLNNGEFWSDVANVKEDTVLFIATRTLQELLEDK